MKPLRKAVLAIFVNESNEVLIGSSPRDGGFKFPQGGMEPHETPLESVIRELHEELGLVISIEDIHTVFEETVIYLFPEELTQQRTNRGQELHVFKIIHKSCFEYIPQDDEFDEMHWKQASEILELDLSFRKAAYEKALFLCKLL